MKIKELKKLPQDYLDRNDIAECPSCNSILKIHCEGTEVICPKCRAKFWFGERIGF